ncbi:arf-GAP with SH3 domain, ANK repeat and PH domain-containing protein 1 [Oncorhynchus mykiss]|uniref:arf-GAP with SH3 domain, ANK repeat and PH domain-containing protein 1 n=1 Tax=Oncorhynchus mykiss TaxID=8022 RepID=UPI0018778958|nr:arf-GAP with SH3 domain, ANK repeat and PH domain-containing protein 1 [Oncorhynchus mykiss]
MRVLELAAEDLTVNKTLQHLDRFFKLYQNTVSMRVQELAAEDLTANKTLQHLDRFFKLYHSTGSMRVLELAAEDLTVNKTLQHLDRFFELYHNTVSMRVQELAAEDLTTNKTLQHLDRFFKLYHNTVSMRVQELAAEDLTTNKTLHLDRFFKLYHNTVSMRVQELAAEDLTANKILAKSHSEIFVRSDAGYKDQISVSEFLSETTEDYNSPTTSSFTTRLQSCKNTVNVLEKVPTVRQEYINAKYLDHKFAHQTGKAVPGKLSEAVRSRDLLLLIQIYAEGAELMEPLPEAGKIDPSQPSPVKKDRSPRPQSFGHSSSMSSPQDKLTLPGGYTPHRDKQRLSYGAFANPVYNTSTDMSPSPGPDGTTLPSRTAGKGSVSTPPPTNRTSPGNKFEQQQSATISNTKSTLGPRVLPKLPQKVALRKINTIHLPSVDKLCQPPEVLQRSTCAQLESYQKSPQPLQTPRDTPRRAPLAEKTQLSELPPKPQMSDLPPKPQLSDQPPKRQLSNLPPKPQLKDLPPKPQLSDIPPKPPVSERLPPGEALQTAMDKQSCSQQGELSPRQASEDTNGSPPCAVEMPVPLPRKINTGKSKTRRLKTIYDCQADNDEELTFAEGEVIIVTGEEDPEWWIGHIEGNPERKGVFPMSFVHILSD